MKNLAKIIAIIMLAAMPQILSADEYNYSTVFDNMEFTQIEADGNFDITLIKSDKCRIEVEYKEKGDMEIFTVKTNGETLILDAEMSKSRKKGLISIGGSVPEAKVTIYARQISSIYMAGSCELESKDAFGAQKFYLQTVGASSIEGVNIDATYLECYASGASEMSFTASISEGNLKTEGSAELKVSTDAGTLYAEAYGSSEMELEVRDNSELQVKSSGAAEITIEGDGYESEFIASGASDIKATEFTCETVNVQCSGSARANVFASESLTASASGASTVRFAGNPANVSENTSGAGSVKAL